MNFFRRCVTGKGILVIILPMLSTVPSGSLFSFSNGQRDCWMFICNEDKLCYSDQRLAPQTERRQGRHNLIQIAEIVFFLTLGNIVLSAQIKVCFPNRLYLHASDK